MWVEHGPLPWTSGFFARPTRISNAPSPKADSERISTIVIHVFGIEVPPLRQRRSDVPLLAAHFLEKFGRSMGKSFEGFEQEAMDRLVAHDWPGNVRELANAVERALVVGKEPLIRARDLPPIFAAKDRLEPRGFAGGRGEASRCRGAREDRLEYYPGSSNPGGRSGHRIQQDQEVRTGSRGPFGHVKSSLCLVPIYFAAGSELLRPLATILTRIFGLSVVEVLPNFDPEQAFDRGRGQYDSRILLRLLLDQVPESDGRVLGVTGVDLFIPILTFVFGEAQLGGRAALVSTRRLRAQAYGLPQNEDLLFRRLCKEAIHELGHNFELLHCADPRCVMVSSTYVEGIDLKSDRFCTRCLELLRPRLADLLLDSSSAEGHAKGIER